jgi:hypothetical protein
MDQVLQGPGEDPVAPGIANCVLALAIVQRRVKAGKKAMNGKCRRSSSLAECERDGIVMGF